MMVHRFYAVTTTSVYLVSDEKGEYGWPIVEKVALCGESRVKVGGRLKGGTSVGVARGFILLYDSHKGQPPEMVNTIHWGGYTSGVIGLFMRKREAMACLKTKYKEILDPRWKAQTEEVRRRIGHDHPVFILSDMPLYR
jgi:hypothetical protein